MIPIQDQLGCNLEIDIVLVPSSNYLYRSHGSEPVLATGYMLVQLQHSVELPTTWLRAGVGRECAQRGWESLHTPGWMRTGLKGGTSVMESMIGPGSSGRNRNTCGAKWCTPRFPSAAEKTKDRTRLAHRSVQLPRRL